jgi:diguanylate cyclase (GGDEF)-like protein
MAELPSGFPDNPRYIFESIGDDVGLGTRAVTMILQSSQGFVWIGTQDGLFRCDSSRTTSYGEADGLPDTWVHQLVEGPDGAIWVSAGESVVKFDGIGFQEVESLIGFELSSRGTQLRQRLAISSDNTIYLAAAGGLGALTAATGEIRVWSASDGLPDGAVDAVHVDTQDRVWFACGSQVGVLSTSTGEVRLLPLPPAEIRELVLSVLCDSDGIVWARTQNSIVRYDSDSPEPEADSYRTAESAGMGMPSLDRSGGILIPSAVGLYYREGVHWRTVSAANGLRVNAVTYALEDREGALWIGLYGAGVQKWIGRRRWAAWTSREGLPDDGVWGSLRDPQGRLWVGTNDGVGIWLPQESRWKILKQRDGISGTRVWKLLLGPQGWVWSMSRRTGLNRYHPQSLKPELIELPAVRPQDFARAPDGSLWICTPDALLVCRSEQGELGFTEVPLPTGMDELEVVSVASDGAVWTGGASGAGRYAAGSWLQLDTGSGLRSNRIMNITGISSDEVWLAYREARGVTRLRLIGGQPQVDHFGREQGLTGDRVWMLDQDHQGRIWVGGADGLSVISAGGEIRVFDQGDGLIWNDIAQGGFLSEPDGSVLIGTGRGLAYYQPSDHVEPQPAPEVVITSVVLGGRQSVREANPQVAYAQNSFSATFAGLSFRNPTRIAYRYRLDGWEQEPVETRQVEVHYAALPAGSYRFEVWCRSAAGIWSLEPAVYSFTVRPPWWQRWWSRLLVILLLVVAVLLILRVRTSRLATERSRLEAAVAERSVQLRQANQELRELSNTDALTGARNRRFFYEVIDADVSATLRKHDPPSPVSRPNQDLSFLLLDFDHFKRVNDRYGHLAGDRVLIEAARRLDQSLRKSDLLVRWGGEEFLILCRNVERREGAKVAGRVLNLIGTEPFTLPGGRQLRQTCSVGWANLPGYLTDPEALPYETILRLADKALYLAKKSGRNRAVGVELIEEAHQPDDSLDWIASPLEELEERVVRLIQIRGPHSGAAG